MKQLQEFITEVNNPKVQLCDYFNDNYKVNYIYVEFNSENEDSPEINYYKSSNELINDLKHNFDDKRFNKKIIESIKSIQPGESKVYIFGYTSIDEYNEEYVSKEKNGKETDWFFISMIKNY